jgi:hypothetical protein
MNHPFQLVLLGQTDGQADRQANANIFGLR